MADVHASTDPLDSPRRLNLDIWLNILLALLVVAVLAATSFFAYSVNADRKAEDASSASGRIAAALTQQIRQNPNDAALRVRLGEALAAMGKFPQAIDQLNAAIKIDPKHTGAYLDLGVIAMMNKREGEARRYFLKVLELTEKTQFESINQVRENALYNLGTISLNQKQYEEAVGYFKGALRIRKDASDTYYNLAKALQGLQDPDGAIQQLEIAVAFDPNFAEAHYLLGELYKQKKDDVNASYEFKKAADAAPGAEPPREALDAFGPASDWVAKSRNALAANDIEGALTAVLIARNLDPKSFEAVKLHAEILVKRKNLKDALDVYRQAATLDPKNAEVQEQIASLEKQVVPAKKK